MTFMQKNTLIFLSIIFFISESNFSQTNYQVPIASVGNEVITADEFKERYELTPQLNAGMHGGEESAKKEFLYSIIAERLWALEAESKGLNKSELITSTYKAIEKMYVRDALYREEILDKVNLSDPYLAEAFQRSAKILNLNYIFSNDSNEIEIIDQQLKNGINFYSILLSLPDSKLQ
jgi:hypothetical protein